MTEEFKGLYHQLTDPETVRKYREGLAVQSELDERGRKFNLVLGNRTLFTAYETTDELRESELASHGINDSVLSVLVSNGVLQREGDFYSPTSDVKVFIRGGWRECFAPDRKA